MKQRKAFYILLKENGISVYSLADELGISPQAIYKWINGTGTPSPKAMLRLAERLNITAEAILKMFEN